LSEEFGNTKGVIRIRKPGNDNTMAKRKKDKRTNNDLQNIHMQIETG
jgi:hypothetical protein